MSETMNYKLYVTDDSSERFQDWRRRMGGVGSDSNMVKIDQVLGQKADNSVLVNATLLSTAWSGVDSPFTQELAVEGLGATQNGSISVAHSATFEQRESARDAMLSIISQENGKLTIAADGELPELDIPVYIILLG